MSTTQHLSITDCHDAEAHTSHPNIPQCRAQCRAYSSPSACVGLISPRNSTQRLLHSLTSVAKLALGNSNPILPGWNPDPTILRVGDDYFISTSTFEYVGESEKRQSDFSMTDTRPALDQSLVNSGAASYLFRSDPSARVSQLQEW